MKDYNPDRKWIIEVTEEQLFDIINDVEDIDRFLAGQTELYNTTCYIEPFENVNIVRDGLLGLKQFITPYLDYNASYSWNGGDCPNEHQRKKIARNYAIYRNLRHCYEKFRDDKEWNVYQGETLTCGIPLAICYPKDEL